MCELGVLIYFCLGSGVCDQNAGKLERDSVHKCWVLLCFGGHLCRLRCVRGAVGWRDIWISKLLSKNFNLILNDQNTVCSYIRPFQDLG